LSWAGTLLELGRLQMGPEYPGADGAFAEPVDVPVNALLLRGGGGAILVDTGAGIGDPWWPGAAGLECALADAGCRPAEITQIVITHLDFDHSGGLLAGSWPDAVRPAFPQARVAVLGDGLAWWRERDPLEPFNAGTRALSELAGAGLLDEVESGTDVAPGVRLVAAPGHRPGHACVVVEGGLVHLADVVHHAEHVAHPEWDPEFDADPALARATRLRWFELLASSGIEVVHAHVAGAGRVARAGAGFTWEPSAPSVRATGAALPV
jgi:glyoxylase-like metal-dependent hydrolase (beta-lactamase superfamily II)